MFSVCVGHITDIHNLFRQLSQIKMIFRTFVPSNNQKRICMKSLHRFIWILVLVAICNVSCGKDDPEPSNNNNNGNDKEEPSLLVSQYLVYDGMALYYLWNEQMLHREPTEADTDPKRYFRTLLDPIDRRNDWSWITDDVDALLRNFAGETARVLGLAPLRVSGFWPNRYVVFVRYVYPKSSAYEAGIERGNAIWEIDGRPITAQNINLLSETNREIRLTIFGQDDPALSDGNIPLPVTTWEVAITPESFPSNPVLHYSVHPIGDRVIGYLFYTTFRSGTEINNFNEYLFQAFSYFKRRNVTDLVLDLRYNPGGEVSAAIYLASMIAPRADVENNEVFTIMSYNRFMNAEFDRNFEINFPRGPEYYRRWERNSRLGAFNDDLFQNPLNANINPNGNLRVYIIATRFSASASELTIFCLRPFMEVVHIGEETQGKYTASWTVHAFDNFFVGEGANRIARVQRVHDASRFTSAQREELRNWAMQLIVGTYTDRDGRDFVAEGTLRPNERIPYSIQNWKPIGDERDFLFAKAISLITGQPSPAAISPAATRSASDKFIGTPILSPQEEQLRRAVNVDNVEIDPEMLREMLRSLR